MNAATTIPELMRTLGLQARCAAAGMARATAAQKAHALRVLARLLREHTQGLQTDNAKDLGRAKAAGLAEPMVDRLKLSPKYWKPAPWAASSWLPCPTSLAASAA